MSVCLSARVSQQRHEQTLLNFLFVLPVAMAQVSSDDSAMHYVLLVLWMTSCFPKKAIWRMNNKAYTQSDSPGAEPEAKCDIYDCLIFRI